MKTIYEWSIEWVENGDITDSEFSSNLGSFAKMLGETMNDSSSENGTRLCLYIRREGEGKCMMFWSYAERGADGKLTLPETAEDSYGIQVKVPARFHKELAKCQG